MRSRILLALFAAACGNLSNEDLAFIEAIPAREQLQLHVPQPTAQPACALGDATIFESARTTGDSINAGVGELLALVDAIRGAPPTTRSTDARTWGPFADQKHPGFLVAVKMERFVDESGAAWRWSYEIDESPAGGAALPIVEGTFYGAQAANGQGSFTLHFESSSALGIAAPTDPRFPMHIYYDLGDEPRTISLDLTGGPGFGVPGFDYAWAGYADGHGQFDYALAGTNGCTTEVSTRFDGAGAGRDLFHVRCGPFVSQDVQQCWDDSSCLVYADDPLAATAACNGVKPCVLGNPSSCVALPE